MKEEKKIDRISKNQNFTALFQRYWEIKPFLEETKFKFKIVTDLTNI